MNRKPIVLIGAGGHFLVVFDAIRAAQCLRRPLRGERQGEAHPGPPIALRAGNCNRQLEPNTSLVENGNVSTWEIVGVIDPALEPGSHIQGIQVLGGDDVLPGLLKKGISHIFVALAMMDYKVRRKVFERVKKHGFKIPPIIHPTAVVSPGAKIGEGVFIAANAVVNREAELGNGVIVNTSASVDHECKIGDFVHITPGVHMGGKVKIGENSYIGLGASIIHEIQIGKNTIIGAGSVVVKDIDDNIKAYGNPCSPKLLS